METLLRLPDCRVILDRDALEPYRHDESHLTGPRPRAAVRPRTPAALRQMVRLAKAEGIGLVPRGQGTGKAGGCVPKAGNVVVDLSEWPGQIQVSRADMALSAPAGVLLRDVKAAAAGEGLYYPPDPNSWDQCGFGGSLATNAGGPCAAKYGMTRHWVLSVDALMEDGELHRFGISTVKCNAGPNLAQLLVGSEGIFGMIVGATVKVIPEPAERVTLLLPVRDWHELLDLPGQLVGAGYLPAAFEFWDPTVMALLRAHGPEEARRLPGEALALLEFDDPGCASDAFQSGLLDLLGPAAEDLRMAADSRQREALWAIRRMTSTILKELHPGKVSEDVVVPRSRVREFFEGVARLELPLITYGHLGDGNLHVNLLSAADTDTQELDRQIHALFALCLELGGSLTGEHGIGLAKRAAFLDLADPYLVQTLRALKRTLDPCAIFNPGKVI